MPQFQSPKGMHDILPDDALWYTHVRDRMRATIESHGFGRIETPILENQAVFEKGVGGDTDIVEKELYTLRTKGGDKLALRPEGTAAIVRSYLEHGMKSMTQPVRLYYEGPMFRHERQQKGRYRQFWQAGVEILGEKDAVADAETILVTMNALREAGLSNLTLQVNSIGSRESRASYVKALKNFMRKRQNEMAPDDKKRITSNPLRVLDSKDERTQRALADAPEILDYLNEGDRSHLRSVLEYLEELDIPYLVNPRLVRGLDYYSQTVFEVWPEMLEGENQTSQGALAGGGRYDDLFRLLGSRATGAVGSSIGIDRVVAALREQDPDYVETEPPHIFLAQLGEQAKRKALALYEELRAAGFVTRASFGRSSIKSQLRIADRLKAPYVAILGQKEVADNTVIIRSMQRGTQTTVKREALIKELAKRISRQSTTKKVVINIVQAPAAPPAKKKASPKTAAKKAVAAARKGKRKTSARRSTKKKTTKKAAGKGKKKTTKKAAGKRKKK